MLHNAPLRPKPGPLERLFLVAAGIHQGGELVEREHDVRPELVLHLHRDFRSKPVPVTVQMRLEPDAVVVNMRQPLLARRNAVIRPGQGS